MGCLCSKKREDERNLKSDDELKSPDHSEGGYKHGSQVHDAQCGHKVDDSGARVFSDAYCRARQKAEEHAIKRGKIFVESKKAFDEGRKSEAHSLSEEGKMHGIQMEEESKRAVAEILNPQHLMSSDRIDLHGLTAREAEEATKEFVASKIGKLKTVFVITGKGNHSSRAKGPVLKPAIQSLCRKYGWQMDSDPQNPGYLIIHVPSN